MGVVKPKLPKQRPVTRHTAAIVPPPHTAEVLLVESVDGPAGIELGQCNLKACDKRLKALCTAMEQKPKPWDVVAIVDPPKSLPWWHSELRDYHIWYNTGGDEIDEAHNPRVFPSRRGKNEEKPKLFRIAGIAFLVRKMIAVGGWAATLQKSPGLSGNVATLSITTTTDDIIRIHGAYNRNTEINLDELAKHCMGGSDVLVGDFNLAARLWSSNAKSDPLGEKLARLIDQHNMVCLNQPGVLTYSRSKDTTKNSSVIDLIFVSDSLVHLVSNSQVLDLEGFESDHRVLSHSFAVGVRHERTNRVNFKRFNKARFVETVGEKLGVVGDPTDLPFLAECRDVDRFLDSFCDAMTAAVKEEQGRTGARLDKKIQTAIKRAQDLAQRRLAASEMHASAVKTKMATIRPENVATGLAEKLRKWRWKNCGHVLAHGQDIFRLAKLAASAARPRELAHMPDLSNGAIKNATGEDNARTMMDATFPDYSDQPPEPIRSAAPQLESTSRPASAAATADPPPGISSPQKLLPGEIRQIINHFPTGKSALPDGLPYEVFKLSVDACVPYIEHIFDACIKLQYHPLRFRFAVTLIAKKAGKSNYRVASSWRPIALQSCLGKILERVITNRYTDVVLAHSLLPDTQFSAPGRSCPQALEYLLSVVHRGWCPGRYQESKSRFVSMMTLDMKGAFNRVPHAKLLDVLESMGIPEWLVNITRSFLSGRSTRLAMPGHLSRVFFVNIGVPQGSPLSPILFALFTAGLLKRLETTKVLRLVDPCAEKFVFAYADDNHIMIISKSFKMNCLAFQALHPVIMEWAKEHGASFGPSKYHVMHFVPPWTPSARYKEERGLRPNIEGLPADVVKEVVRVLGLMIHYRLSWSPHVDYIVDKVKKSMNHFRRISGSVWGAPLKDLRRLYLAKIRPVISFACSVWYTPGQPGSSWRAIQEALRALERQCLIQFSGAFRRTHGLTLMKELNIEFIDLFLARSALATRAKSVGTPHWHKLNQLRTKPLRGLIDAHSALLLHPLHALDKEADVLRTRAKADLQPPPNNAPQKPRQTLVRLGDLIDKHAKSDAASRMATEWDAYRIGRLRGNPDLTFEIPALVERWGDKSWKYYAKLDRQQATMLLQCRTSYIGLRLHLFRRAAPEITSPRCECGTSDHTVKHLLLDCPNLGPQRLALESSARHLDFSLFLTEDTKVFTTWAICHFGLDHFKTAAEAA